MIYYIACTATQRLKIGYTQGEPEVRLKQLQTGSAANLRLICCHEGSLDDERRIHSRFAEQRMRGEWFEMSEDLFKHISWIVWATGVECADTGQPASNWVKVGLRAMADGAPKPLPAELAALI